MHVGSIGGTIVYKVIGNILLRRQSDPSMLPGYHSKPIGNIRLEKQMTSQQMTTQQTTRFMTRPENCGRHFARFRVNISCDVNGRYEADTTGAGKIDIGATSSFLKLPKLLGFGNLSISVVAPAEMMSTSLHSKTVEPLRWVSPPGLRP